MKRRIAGFSVGEPHIPNVLGPIDDATEVGQANGSIIPVHDYQVLVILRFKELIGGGKLINSLSVFEFTLWLVCVGALQEAPDLI